MRKSKSISNSIFINILKGLISGIISFVIILAVFSIVILKTDASSGLFYIFVLIAVGFSALSGAFVTALCARKSRLILSMLTSVLLLSICFVLLLCFNNATLSIKIYLTVPVAIISGFIGAVTGTNIIKK